MINATLSPEAPVEVLARVPDEVMVQNGFHFNGYDQEMNINLREELQENFRLLKSFHVDSKEPPPTFALLESEKMMSECIVYLLRDIVKTRAKINRIETGPDA